MRHSTKHQKRHWTSRFSWAEYLLTFTIMALLASLPALMYGYDSRVLTVVWDYFGWYVLYWAFIAGIFTSYTAYRKYQQFDVPLLRLSEATQQVASGDFSVYVKPIHRSDQEDYLDKMVADFNKMVKELGSLDTMKTDFVATISHEIKTPLAIIQNYAEVVQNPEIEEAQRQDYLMIIRNTTRNLSEIVTNSLMLNKLEHQEIIAVEEPYDVSRQLTEIVLSCEGLFRQKNLSLVVAIEDCAHISANAHLMELVWRNLLTNAVKFSANNEEIQVMQTSTTDTVIVKIVDFGIGMDAETQQHIFDKFYQGSNQAKQSGNGIGLALVKKVMEQVNGQIYCESQEGQGTTITVILPAAQ